MCALLKLRRLSKCDVVAEAETGDDPDLLGSPPEEEVGVGRGSGDTTRTGRGRVTSLVARGELVSRASSAMLIVWNLCTRRSSCEVRSLSKRSSVSSRRMRSTSHSS